MGPPSPAAWMEGLNAEQAAAVSAHPDCALLVLAGAGSGKTTVLTRRAAYLSDPAFGGKGVLALTFTKDAALEMETRLRASGAWERTANPPWIGTFHAFAFSLIREGGNWARLGFAACPRLLGEEEAEAWVRNGLESAGAAGRAPDLTPSGLLAWLEDTFAEASDGEGERADWRDRFRAHLRSDGLLRFGDMVTLALHLLEAYAD